MVNTSSLPGGAGVSFDLDSQSGVMQVLAAVRTSDLGASQKNELRDLVFLYSNGGKEPTVRRALEQKISLYKLVPPPGPAPKVVVPQPTIGKFRSAPTFSAPAPSAPVEQKTAEPAFASNPVWTHPKPSIEPEVVVHKPVSVPQPVVPVPEATPVEEVVEVTPAPVVATPTIMAGDNDAYLMRIREIKALVNEQVGNPVNLVDINNEVGREYMAALLDAMKKINSGTSAASAMKRLENAYASVEEALKVHKNGGAAVAAPPTPISVLSSVFEPVTTPTPPQPAFDAPTPVPSPTAPTYEYTPVTPDPAPAPYMPTAPVFEPMYKAPQAPVIHQTTQPNITPVVPLGEPAPIAPKPPESASYFATLADYNSKPSPVADAGRPNSLKESAVAGDPLFTPEVDDGLQQLLLEWPIFKKSGIFGTGPKGREHPLFKKVSPLQIPLLLAGRFEGATQEIKQSITDYMNGWRYEQGIIYQQNETFEHYLRRVIRHILDLQKAGRG
jgi:hypothetical protein